MLETIITLKGLRDSHLAAKMPITRIVKFPDGISRHITLPGWQWAVFDRYDRDHAVLSPEDVLAFAFEAAEADIDHPAMPFEQKIRRHLSIFLNVGVPWTSDYIPRKANDF